MQSAKFIQNHQKDLHNISIYGQEANPNTWKMCHMNLAIRGLEGNRGTYADTFFDDQHPTLKADFIMANPPFNLDKWDRTSFRTMCAGCSVSHLLAMPTLHGCNT